MKSSIFLTAAALAATGFSFAPAMAANATNAASTPPSNASVNGSETSSAASSSLMTDVKIQSVIAGVTQDALTPGDMKHLISFFPPTQQENIRKSSSFSQGYGDKLDARIDSISRQWKQKYGHDFAISASHDAMNRQFTSIMVAAPVQKNGQFESARVNFMNAKGKTELQVPLVCENGNSWRIDIPNSLTAEKLRANLLEQLTDMDSHFARWPAHETDAYRVVAHHVLSAVLDKPMPIHAQYSAMRSTTKPTQEASVMPAIDSAFQHWYQFWNW